MAKQTKLFIPPTLEEVKEFFKNNNTGFVFKESVAVQFWSGYEYANPAWTDRNGTPIRSWKTKAVQVWFTEQNRQTIPVINMVNKSALKDVSKETPINYNEVKEYHLKHDAKKIKLPHSIDDLLKRN